MKTKISMIIGMLALSACAPQGNFQLKDIASQTVEDIACQKSTMESKLWDGLKDYLLEQKQLPDVGVLRNAMLSEVKAMSVDQGSNDPSVRQLKEDLINLVDVILREAPEGERVETPEELLMLISAIDVGDRSTVFRDYLQTKVRRQFDRVQLSAQSANLVCPPGSEDEQNEQNEQQSGGVEEIPSEEIPFEPQKTGFDYHRAQALNEGLPLAAFGGRWAFATAYQSCQSVQLPSMNAQTPNVAGIQITGKHSDGVGSKRMIASLSQVQNSHYYVRDMRSYGQGCFNVRETPLIYDYGGKPYATTATDSPIDLFKNNGSGTTVLGIDCSAYVFSSLATVGLRLKEGRVLKASDSWAWGSTSYVEPEKNGLTCLSKISVTSANSIQSGDIVAVSGHVLLIDKMGTDPFGIRSARTESDCSKITSDSFDFSVGQSSPSKNGIGINFYEARNYLPTSAKFKTGLEKYAYYACLAKVNNRSYTPNLGTLSVVRHKGTAACMAPRVKMARESCIETCSSFRR